MIPDLAASTERLGVNLAFAPLLVAALLTAFVLFAHSLARWFEDRNP